MGFLTAVGAIVVGSVSSLVGLTAVLLGWTWANEKLKSHVFEPTLHLALLVTVILLGYLFHYAAGDAGVLGVILGVAGWGYLVYLHMKEKQKPKNMWEQFLSRFDKK